MKMGKVIKRLTRSWLTFFFLLIVLAGTVYARYEFDPQYKNQGTVGRATNPWGEGGFRDLGVTRNLDFCGSGDDTITDAGVSRFYSRVFKVTNYNQLTATEESGASIFILDPSLYKASTFEIDLTAISNSALPLGTTGLTVWAKAFTGLTVAPVTPTAANDGYEFSLTKPDTSTSPIYLWQPTEDNSGTTVTGTLRALDREGVFVTGASTFRIDAQGDNQTFRLQYDSAISVQQKAELISG